MAPLRPLPSANAAPRKSILKDANKPKKVSSESLFPTTKKDKRAIKHAHLMSKVAKSASPQARRRRPNKKLVTTLDALADALPDNDDEQPQGHAGSAVEQQVNVIKRKSIKSRPGALKRKEKLDRGERERFAKNLAQMTGFNASTTTAQSTLPEKIAPTSEDRWKALRGFISQTMEKKPELTKLT